MPRDAVEVTVEAFVWGAVPMFRVRLDRATVMRGVYLYQRDDGAWLPVFPSDGAAIEIPARAGSIDIPEVVGALFPEYVR